MQQHDRSKEAVTGSSSADAAAGVFSGMGLYGWKVVCDICALFPLVLRGRLTPLSEDDLPECAPATFAFNRCGRQFDNGRTHAISAQIDRAAESAREEAKKPGAYLWLPIMVRMALKERKALVLQALACGMVHGFINSVGRFTLLRGSIQAVVTGAPMATRAWLSVGVVLVLLCEGFLLVIAKHLLASHLGHYVGGRMSTLILNKVSRIGTRPQGAEETQFIGADMPQLVELTRIIAFLPSGLVGLASGMVVLVVYLSWSGVVGISLLVVMFVANVKVSSRAKQADKRAQDKLKDRLRGMKQVVEGVKAIKFYAWEESYVEKVTGMRDVEVAAQRVYKQIQAVGVIIGRAGPIFATAAVFVIRTAQGSPLSSAEAFATLAIFQTLRVGMIFLPLSITFLGILHSNLMRTEAYLATPEPDQPETLADGHIKVTNFRAQWMRPLLSDFMKHPSFVGGTEMAEKVDDITSVKSLAGGAAVLPNSLVVAPFDPLDLFGEGYEATIDDALEGYPRVEDNSTFAPFVGISGSPRGSPRGTPERKECDEELGIEMVSTKPAKNRDNFILDVPSLEVRPGQLIAVVGQVGSGKSMLLDALLGGGPATVRGFVGVGMRSMGLIEQESLVISGTVEENVIMGRPMDAGRFAWAVQCACMERDLTLLPHGAATVLGERGTTLSGGQQQRLCIARALFGAPRLLVADDPIAAVDAVVGAKIFENIRAYVDGETVGGSDNAGCEGPRAALVVLNQLHLLPRTDLVVFINNGSVVAQGPYANLLAKCGAFREYVASYSETKTVDDCVVDGSSGIALGAPAAAPGSGFSSAMVAVAPPVVAVTPAGDKPGQLITKEEYGRGWVRLDVLLEYIHKGGYGLFAASVGVLLLSFIALASNDLWLQRWTAAVDRGDISGGSWFHCGVYCALSFSYIILNLSGSSIFIEHQSRASKYVHIDGLKTILAAPLSWFESVPSGRILSRFGSDLYILDVQFGFYADGLMQMVFSTSMILAVIASTDIRLLGLCVACFVCFFKGGSVIFQSLRQMKRIANTAMSPVVTNVTEAVRGRLVGRTLGCDRFFVARHLATCQHFLQAAYTAQSLMQFNAVMTQIIAITVSSTVSVFVLLNPKTDKDLAGIALTYSFLLPYFLSLASDMFMMFFSVLPALERVFEFLPGGDIPAEAPRSRPGDAALVTRGWPEAGGVVFDTVEMRYRKDTPLALKGLSMEIKRGEKCGIVGRTGAGKSSLLAVLFRLTEPASGIISIDGVNLSGVGLKTLRQSLAMIPQEAVLIEGTVRENLDPFGKESTTVLESALTKVGLSPSILEHQVGTGGDSFSVGERQLLAIARVLLKRNCTVYVMDEPTAHIDPATDAHLQRIIRNEMKGATLLTIAHRLHTVADFDKIVVMDAGRLVEMGRPLDLLNGPPSGHFAAMVRALGPGAAAAIKTKAQEGAARGSGDSSKFEPKSTRASEV